ncbi:MAG TPA: RHS repeat-associated core domain-containing protein, partial [Ohtaekwangia sp.]
EVKEAGYVFAYISNENGTYVEGYFDDVAFTYTPSNIIQYNEYYPFGLQTASSWTRENTKDNRYLYNAGNELNQNSGWYEMFYRGYDPATGRMLQIDPYASSYTSLTPYNYGANNPIMLNDPSGGKVNVPYDVSMSYSQYTMMYGDPNIVGGGSGGGFFRSSYMNSARDAAMDRAENYGNEVVEFGGGVEGLAAGLNYLFLGGYLNGINNFTFEYNGTNYGGFYELENGVVTSVSYSEVTLHESGGWVSTGGWESFSVAESTDQPSSNPDLLQVIGAVNGIFQMGTEIAINGTKPNYTGPVSWTNQIKAGQNFTKKLGVLGMGITVVDAAVKGEWKPHHTADLVIGGVTTFLIASNPITATIVGGYFLVDLGVQLYSGKSITEHLFDPE